MGWFSRKKAAKKELMLHGLHGQASTIKCLLMAAIKGLSLNTSCLSSTARPDHTRAYQDTDSDVGALPTLVQGDFSITGSRGILSFMNVRGSGASLVPKKARILGQQNYWIDAVDRQLALAIQKMADGKSDDTAIIILDELNRVLATSRFITGQLSLAEPNVAAYIYVLKNNNVDLGQYPNIAVWLQHLEDSMPDKLKNRYLPLLFAAPT